MEDKNYVPGTHSFVLEDRRSLTVSGVKDVDSFDEQSIVAYTTLGELTVAGSGLHITRFSADVGELAVEGDIAAMSYSENKQVEGGFFSRLFR